jgi:RimJ/RimL family protein N-acetyltransferase
MMAEAVTFRPAVADDLEALHTLVHAAYRGDSARRGWTHEADLLDGSRIDRDSLRAAITTPGQVVLVAAEDDTLTGCVHITDRGEGLAYLGMLTVDPSRQAKGLGRRLIAAAEAQAFRLFQTRRMEMTVIVHRHELIGWYQRRGYRLTGETRPFPATDPRFGLPKRDDLAFTVLEKPLDRIVTERLLLRPAGTDDLDALHAIFTRPEAMTWWSSPPHESRDQTRDWLDSMIAKQDSGLDFLIERDGQVIGKAGFWKAPDIGYILHPDHWGQGLAREAVTAVLDRLFDMTDHEAATADVDPDNAASIRLLESLGFRRTGFAERTWNVGGEWKDSYFYALSHKDWQGRTDA